MTVTRVGELLNTFSSKDYVLLGRDGVEREYDARKKEEHELAETDRNLKVPSGTTAQLFKEFGELDERLRKRQIGRGNIAGKGPRSKTTFRHGHKQY